MATYPIRIKIDGKRSTTTDDDQQASALLRLANRDPKIFEVSQALGIELVDFSKRAAAKAPSA